MTPKQRIAKTQKAFKLAEEAYVLLAEVLREYPNRHARDAIDDYHRIFKEQVQAAEREREWG